jgi:SAM-dependent methyltransferase
MNRRDIPTVVAQTSVQQWMPTVASLQRRFYPDAVRRDPVATFVRRVGGILKPTHRVLDLGAGAGELSTYSFKGRARQVVGIDLDPRVTQNSLLDAGIRGDVYALPFQEASFDVVFSVYVLEHVDRPDQLASEVARVLRPGGMCLVLTPNLFHYVTLVSRLTPTTFHRWMNERLGRPADDTFATWYQMNSHRALRRCFSTAGMDVVAIDSIEVQPNYLAFNAFAYACGVGYERLVNSSDLFSSLRVNLIGQFRKPDAVERLGTR